MAVSNTQTANDDPDLPLVRRAKAGDFPAFEALVTRHEARIYTLALRIVHRPHDAEEVVQETFLSVLQHLKDFREESGFRTWLMRIATNAALKILRKKRGKIVISTDDTHDDQSTPHPEFIAPWREDPADLAQRHEVQQLLEDALQRLDEKYRVVFILRDMEELSIEETAALLQLSVPNVKVRLMRARLMLREMLTQKLGDAAQAAPGHRHG